MINSKTRFGQSPKNYFLALPKNFYGVILNPMTIQQIVERAGGTMKVAVALKIGQSAVFQWYHRGKIPQRYWQYFITKLGVSATDLFNAQRGK